MLRSIIDSVSHHLIYDGQHDILQILLSNNDAVVIESLRIRQIIVTEIVKKVFQLYLTTNLYLEYPSLCFRNASDRKFSVVLKNRLPAELFERVHS